jgi:hypothetical protein
MQQRDESEEYTDPPQDFRTWCEKNNVLWKLAEEIGWSSYPHGNALFEASAIYYSHQVLDKHNFNEQK